MKHVYLLGAILGAIVPYVFFVDFFQTSGFDLVIFMKALFVNGAAGGFSADVFISSGVFWLFLYQQRAKRLWLFILLNLTIGLSCALPLYLYLREVDKTQTEDVTRS